jgi:hypothetical protein
MLRAAGAEENASATRGNGTAPAAKVNAAIPARAFKGMSATTQSQPLFFGQLTRAI